MLPQPRTSLRVQTKRILEGSGWMPSVLRYFLETTIVLPEITYSDKLSFTSNSSSFPNCMIKNGYLVWPCLIGGSMLTCGKNLVTTHPLVSRQEFLYVVFFYANSCPLLFYSLTFSSLFKSPSLPVLIDPFSPNLYYLLSKSPSSLYPLLFCIQKPSLQACTPSLPVHFPFSSRFLPSSLPVPTYFSLSSFTLLSNSLPYFLLVTPTSLKFPPLSSS